MNKNKVMDLFNMSDDVHAATKSVVDIITEQVWPLMLKVKHKLVVEQSSMPEENIERITNVFKLCGSQIKKCLLQLFEIFKLEHLHNCILKDSRLCLLERLSWCVTKLDTIHSCLDTKSPQFGHNESTDSLFVTPMYFVNWIDHTFELLTNLSNIIYREDFKNSELLFDIWKNELLDCVRSLHISVDELLLSALTLGKYCLPVDQNIVSTRCQVVLREAKALMTELIKGDLDGECVITVDSLKLPIMPSNVNILIDVLKDVLSALETNTNTALLNLLVHCFSYNISPIEKLKNHFEEHKERCECGFNRNMVDDCKCIKEFDLYNERLLQIGFFAISCSTDQNRILEVRSAIASLESLEPHLVPAVVMSPGAHAHCLADTWTGELATLRDNVFLIVHPGAFVEKCKQRIHQSLLDVIRSDAFHRDLALSIISVGSVVHYFFSVYLDKEPEALTQGDKLMPLLKDLDKEEMIRNGFKTQLYAVEVGARGVPAKSLHHLLKELGLSRSAGDTFMERASKTALTESYSIWLGRKRSRMVDVQKECNTVFNILTSRSKMDKNLAIATPEKLIKRLKLQYTIVTRINNLYNNDQDDILNCSEINQTAKDLTKSINNNLQTSSKDSPRKLCKTRSIFSRTVSKTIGDRNVLQRLSKHINSKKTEQLNFSVQLDRLFQDTTLDNQSIKTKSSLRKTLLNKNYARPNLEKTIDCCNQTYNKSDTLDVTAALQITEIIDQFTDMTIPVAITKQSLLNITTTLKRNEKKPNILTLNVNRGNSITRRVWNIPVNTSVVDSSQDETDVTSCSTLDRINDLNLLENRLNDLKMLQRETNL